MKTFEVILKYDTPVGNGSFITRTNAKDVDTAFVIACEKLDLQDVPDRTLVEVHIEEI